MLELAMKLGVTLWAMCCVGGLVCWARLMSVGVYDEPSQKLERWFRILWCIAGGTFVAAVFVSGMVALWNR